ncbi:BBP7 family outer membrane beta-barrel protein [Limnoglobus roseus]|uniref:BBP7 family outer membrane beta-barrel protein n=1 Tax=Limnoglobus roseus TaxID=2598579 RepID=A0A5C1A7M1_9BACT|nr:BBP7 family outer membrane beta-barrel protein [Limnoglobus roseus]QEL13842.1 hypothetical protein PX52LOC_00700 [Limnoglobus roseus]
MLTRFLGGVAACVGAAGALSAQQAAPTATAPSSAVPARVAATTIDRGSPLATAPNLIAVQATTPAKPAAPAPVAAKPGTPIPASPATPATPVQTPMSGLLTEGGCSAVACPAPAACAVPCGPPGKFWFDAGYWYGHLTGQNVPPLVTAAPVGTPRAVAGTLGGPGTTVLYPTGKVNSNWRSGFYLNAGMWFDDAQKCGIEGNFFFLGQSKQGYTASDPTGASIITRPFTNTITGLPDTELVSFPGILAGSINVQSRSNIIGGGPNFVKNLCCGPCGRFDLLLGYTYLNVRDEINIQENLTSLPGQTNVTPGTMFQVNDNFKTSNNFHGANIGFATERRYSHYYLGARAGVALGVNHQVIDIDGNTTITPPGGPAQTYQGGLLAQPSNIGHYTRDRFAVMPWVGLKAGVQLTPHLRAYVGYDYLYLSNVVRAGDQIDLRVNPTQIPPRTNGVTGPAFPVFTPKETGVSLNAIRFGLEGRY